MKHVETASGFVIDIDETCLDDMELFDAIVDLQNGDATTIPLILRKILGTGKAALYEHCRAEDGRVPTTVVTEEIKQIFEALNAKKS